jgi:hypothetical protein
MGSTLIFFLYIFYVFLSSSFFSESSFSLTASNIKKFIAASIFNVKSVSVAGVPNNLHYGALNTVLIPTNFSRGIHKLERSISSSFHPSLLIGVLGLSWMPCVLV